MKSRAAQRGYSLVLALWALTLLTTVSMTYVLTARTEATAAAASLRIVEGRGIAEAGVWLAVMSSLADMGGAPEATSSSMAFEFAESAVSVEMRDVSGLINVNRASAELLAAVFASTGMDPSTSADISSAILDWRDIDSDNREGGQEPAAYETSWGTVPVRNGFFMTVDELRAIPGVTHSVFQSVRELFTVFGSHVRVNRNAASERVLSIVSDTNGVPIRRFLQDRGEDIYTVRATTVVGGVTVTLSPIIRIPRRANEGVSVLSWSGDDS